MFVFYLFSIPRFSKTKHGIMFHCTMYNNAKFAINTNIKLNMLILGYRKNSPTLNAERE